MGDQVAKAGFPYFLFGSREGDRLGGGSGSVSGGGIHLGLQR